MTHRLRVGARYHGDVDGDGLLAITDAIVILNHLYLGGWKPRTRLADANLDGRVDIADAVAILAHLFGGEPLPTP